jgi:hypothetical protein
LYSTRHSRWAQRVRLEQRTGEEQTTDADHNCKHDRPPGVVGLHHLTQVGTHHIFRARDNGVQPVVQGSALAEVEPANDGHLVFYIQEPAQC